MKIIVAQCTSHRNIKIDALSIALIDQLRSAEHQTDLIIIPPIGDGFEALMAVASHRLMNLRLLCDALICLDRAACLIQHPRKYAILPDQITQSENTPIPFESKYLANLIKAGTAEAKILKVSVRSGKRQLSSSDLFDFSTLLREFE